MPRERGKHTGCTIHEDFKPAKFFNHGFHPSVTVVAASDIALQAPGLDAACLQVLLCCPDNLLSPAAHGNCATMSTCTSFLVPFSSVSASCCCHCHWGQLSLALRQHTEAARYLQANSRSSTSNQSYLPIQACWQEWGIGEAGAGCCRCHFKLTSGRFYGSERSSEQPTIQGINLWFNKGS